MDARLRRMIGVRIAQVAAALILLGAAVWLTHAIGELREKTYADQQALADLPERDLLQKTRERELASRAHDVTRIRSLVVTREQVGDVVNQLRVVGAEHGVDVRVVRVAEEVPLDEQGKEVAVTGPLREVRLQVVGLGEPEELLVFLHQVEHMQYLLFVPEWELVTEAVPVAPGTASQTTPSGGPAEAPRAQTATGELRMNILVSIHHE